MPSRLLPADPEESSAAVNFSAEEQAIGDMQYKLTGSRSENRDAAIWFVELGLVPVIKWN